jgi:ribosome biogenesis GTPase
MTGAAQQQLPERGRVVACYGRRALVQTENRDAFSCVTRGRRGGIACGDWVRFSPTSSGEGVIEDVDSRSSLIYRSDAKREKAIAANVTQIAIVLAIAPAPNLDFLDRCLIAAEHACARALLILNKTDLAGTDDAAVQLTRRYERLGYRLVSTSRELPVASLQDELRGHLSVLIGQSGVGKSTLVNRLVPGAEARIGETSAMRDAGRHTTTHARLYQLDDGGGTLIDSPGMHAFGLRHVPPADLAECFVEMRALLGSCRFSNCRHDGEPGCGIEAAARAGRIATQRLESYRRILQSIARAGAEA